MASQEAWKLRNHPGEKKYLELSTEEGKANILGFWVFLGAELALFASLFATYLVLHGSTAQGPDSRHLFDAKKTAIDTVVLLTSSFTCSLAIHEMRLQRLKIVLVWFGITLLLGGTFLGLEISEFIHYILIGASLSKSAFLSGFFLLVGIHGAHVAFGSLWMVNIIIQFLQRGFTPRTTRKAFILSLYWHFLDIVWIFIFTLVYLTGMAV
jgi:cytochrome aa3-600 menaquinol oxidase subunit 3